MSPARREAAVPAERGETVRESLRRALCDGPATARDLSKRVGIRERAVADHLDHLARSLARRGERLAVEPSECLDCGFVFSRRERYTRPGRCPECRGRRISLPRFEIQGR